MYHHSCRLLTVVLNYNHVPGDNNGQFMQRLTDFHWIYYRYLEIVGQTSVQVLVHMHPLTLIPCCLYFGRHWGCFPPPLKELVGFDHQSSPVAACICSFLIAALCPRTKLLAISRSPFHLLCFVTCWRRRACPSLRLPLQLVFIRLVFFNTKPPSKAKKLIYSVLLFSVRIKFKVCDCECHVLLREGVCVCVCQVRDTCFSYIFRHIYVCVHALPLCAIPKTTALH